MDRIATEAAGLFLRHAISETDTVRDALEALNRLSGEAMTLFVIEKSGRLAGTLTDGSVSIPTWPRPPIMISWRPGATTNCLR